MASAPRLAAIVLVAGVMGSCGGATTPTSSASTPARASEPHDPAPSSPRPAPAGASEAEVTKEIVEALAAGDAARALAHVSPRSEAGVTADALVRAWRDMARDVGAYRGIERISATTGLGFTAVTARCLTADAAFEVRVLFDARSGGSEPPRATSVLITQAWDPPSYVDAARIHEEGSVIGAGKGALPASVTAPLGDGPFAAVVLLSLGGPGDRDGTVGGVKVLRDLAWGLAGRGVVALRFDERAFAHRDAAQDPEYTPRRALLDDARAAVAAARRIPSVDKRRVYVVGYGLAGRLAMLAAADDPTLAGVVLLGASSRSAPAQAVAEARARARRDGALDDDESASIARLARAARLAEGPRLSSRTPARDLPLGLPAAYWLGWRGLSLERALAKTKARVLVLGGERDDEAPPSDVRGWARLLRRRKGVVVDIVAGCNHLFEEGSGPVTVAEYARPGNVSRAAVERVASFVGE